MMAQKPARSSSGLRAAVILENFWQRQSAKGSVAYTKRFHSAIDRTPVTPVNQTVSGS